MANNEEISQDVKVEETQSVSVENNEVANENVVAETKAENVEVKPEPVKEEKPVKAEKAKKQKKAKDKKPSKIGKRLKETSSELKKVTWPKFGTVVKQTSVVLLVTALFLLVVFGIDRLCSWLMGFII